MYVVRRIYTTKPGEARRAATLISDIGKAYEAAGTRGPSRVYFNSGTTPGARNTVVMEWTDDALVTPYRDDRVRVEGLEDVSAQLRDVTIESEIEFWELMTDEKRI
ncbi:MAG TPA: hypothetical protein VLA29_12355 [Acidimicrobiia bacterium]|nr:hypothetical protein [Acidimicrobiia bacterium]